MQERVREERVGQKKLAEKKQKKEELRMALEKIHLSKRKIMIIGSMGICLIVILNFFTCGVRKKNLTDLEKAGLKGCVKSVAEYHFTFENEDGYLVEKGMQFEDENGVVDYTESFYSIYGILEKYRAVWDSYMNNDSYVYDAGMLKEIKHTFNANRKAEFTYLKYNDKKQLIRKHRNKDGDIRETVYTYDSKGNMTYDGEYEYVYDRKGRLKEKRSNHYREQIFSYDKSGKKKKYSVDFSDPSGYYDDYSCDYSLKYDKDGRVIKEKCIDKDSGVKSSYEYKYTDDEKGNWIIQTKYKDGNPKSKIVRRIEYHDDNNQYSKLLYPIPLMEKAYEKGLSYKDFLRIPEIKDLIVNAKSLRFYNLALAEADYSLNGEMILHKDVKGFYHIDTTDEYTGCGSKLTCGDNFDIQLYLLRRKITEEGIFNVLPWKIYYTNGLPYYSYIQSFERKYNGNVNQTEDIEIRIDEYGLKFRNISNQKHSCYPVLSIDHSFVSFDKYSNGTIFISWNNDEIEELPKRPVNVTISYGDNIYGANSVDMDRANFAFLDLLIREYGLANVMEMIFGK